MSEEPAPPRLTAFTQGGGCATKIGQADLLRLLGGWPETLDQRVLVGPGAGDDAAVVRAGIDTYIVFTTDFFAPIVDDPDDYGAIAATNALSDVYAMGGVPLAALNLVAWPNEETLAHSTLRRVLDAARGVVVRAGASIVGGHSVIDPEPKVGLAVIGTVNPSEILTNAAGRPGDLLLLSKPLGTGIVANALKRGEVTDEVLAAAVACMKRLNDQVSLAARQAGVRCATDVTGFGLLGHLHALTLASGCAAEIRASALPVLPGVLALVERNLVPGGSMRNKRFADEWTTWGPEISASLRILAVDAQTSGGLLLAAQSGIAESVMRLTRDDAPVVVVGRLVGGTPGTVSVVA
jgi:selenide,water dikinase